MNSLVATLTLLFIIWEFSDAAPRRAYYANESTLELVHVLFRHGDRNPDVVGLYPSNPNYAESNYYPYGYGQLTNEGKMREYKLGTALRLRYNNFLGKVWNMSVIDVRSTNYDRTKMSAELMTAGLSPPTTYLNIWNSVLNWQPIPYNYEKVVDDKELIPFLGCPAFPGLINEVIQSPEVGHYMSARYNETMTILANRTAMKMSYLQAVLLYIAFDVQKELNLPLEDWVSSVYPEPLHSLAIDYYYIETNNTRLRKLRSGYLIKKILTDTQRKIDGTLTPKGRKMFVYSGHDTNIAGLLLSLNAYKIAEFPPYGAYVLVEVHKIDEVYGIKLFYQDYKSDDPKILQMTGCDEFCPLDEFISLVEAILPISDEECYGTLRR